MQSTINNLDRDTLLDELHHMIRLIDIGCVDLVRKNLIHLATITQSTFNEEDVLIND